MFEMYAIRVAIVCVVLWARANGQMSCMPKKWAFEGVPLAWMPVGNTWFTKLQTEATFYEQVQKCASIESGRTSIGTVLTEAEHKAISNSFTYNVGDEDLSTVNKFGPFAVKGEYTKRLTLSILNRRQSELVKSCTSNIEVNTDVKFRIQRDDSYHSSKVTYLRLDTNKVEEFLFTGGATDHTRLEYDGKTLSLACRASTGSPGPQCHNLPVGVAIKAVVFAIDFNPRAGGFTWDQAEGQWQRNQYNFSGSYYKISCKSPGVYLGGFELGNTGQWFWWPGPEGGNRIMNKTFWKKNHPSKDDLVGHCIQNTKDNGGGWLSVPCSSKGKVVCQLRC